MIFDRKLIVQLLPSIFYPWNIVNMCSLNTVPDKRPYWKKSCISKASCTKLHISNIQNICCKYRLAGKLKQLSCHLKSLDFIKKSQNNIEKAYIWISQDTLIPEVFTRHPVTVLSRMCYCCLAIWHIWISLLNDYRSYR